MNTEAQAPQHLSDGARQLLIGYLAVCAAVLALLMVFGLLLRLGQAGIVPLPANLAYQVMTAPRHRHGRHRWLRRRRHHVVLPGSVGGAHHGSTGRQPDPLPHRGSADPGRVFLGGFAAAWTFLYPLPAQLGGVWGASSATIYLIGVLIVGVGFLLLHLETGRAILARYGGLGRALGWPQLFGGSSEEAPPPTVVASTMVLIINTLGLLSGAVILVMTIVNIHWPGFALDPLLAKNMIFFFGHIFINATIYMAVIAIYEILPRYTDRPWKASRPFLIAWTASLVMVLAVYPHHLLMDFVMPTWMLVMGQIVSYLSGLPVPVVTALGVLINVSRSGIRWDMTSGLLFLAVVGWSIGVIPAIVDGTIVVNAVMHNTLWVPGHFHTYLLLGQVTMVFGFMYYVVAKPGSAGDIALDRSGLWVFAVASLGFSATFLYAGRASVPRRFAEHLPEWTSQDVVGSVFAALVIAAVLIFVVRFFTRLGSPKAA